MGERKSEFVGRWQVPERVIERLLPNCAHQWNMDNPEADRPTFKEGKKIAKELLMEPDPPPHPRMVPRIAWAERNSPTLAASMRKTPNRYFNSGEPENIAWEFFTARWIRKDPDLVLRNYFIPKAKYNPDYWEALEQIEVSYHRKGQPLPQGLAEWRVDVIEKKLKKPRRKRGRPRKNSSRDMQIVHCISVLEFLGMKPMRNDATERKESACDVVAEVLEKSYRTIKRIWLRAGCKKS